MKVRFKDKKGMMVLVLAAGLVFVMIVFTSIINRMRAEALITNRVSINERLNQLASAVGRIAIRKLQRAVELNDTEEKNSDGIGHGQYVVKWIVEHQGQNAEACRDDYSNIINSLPVVKQLISNFEAKFGRQGKPKIEVFYNISMGTCFKNSKYIDGLVDNNGLERPGSISVDVVITLESGVSRKYTVKKDYIFARLLAPPFYRFNLFSHNGANLNPSEANKYKFNSDGESIESGKYPFVCLNRLRDGISSHINDFSPDNNTDFYSAINRNSQNKPLVNSSDDYIKNGWIYLGGEGSSEYKNGDKALILNVQGGGYIYNKDGAPVRPDLGDMESSFGEFFHFHYLYPGGGWIKYNDNDNNLFGTELKNFEPPYDPMNPGLLFHTPRLAYMDYGLYDGIFDTDTKLGKVFGRAKMQYSGDKASLDFGSNLHLFGTPMHCCPTLVFGKVKRRYLHARSIIVGVKGVGDLPMVMPTVAKQNTTSIRNTNGLAYLLDESSSSKPSVRYWFIETKKTRFQASLDPNDNNDTLAYILPRFLTDKIVNNQSDGTAFDIYYKSLYGNGIAPYIDDRDPYVYGLYNICNPINYKKEIAQDGKIVKNNDLSKFCDSEFEFDDSSKDEIPYTGKISNIKINYENYLIDSTTYTFKSEAKNTPYKIDDYNEFFNTHFFLKDDNNKNYFLLNQIIRVEGDLEIKKELNVAQGGVIVCTGKITVKAPIINKYIEEGPDTEAPGNFGFLTLVAKNGIEFTAESLVKKDGAKMPRIEAFLVAGCEEGSNAKITLPLNNRVHIIGGVATDDITDIVANGCVLEYGFSNGELDHLYAENDPETKSYCGLAIGPRDIEIYSGN